MAQKQSVPPLRVIVGLGNPGDKYTETRHNAGFLFIDRLKNSVNVVLETRKYSAELTVVTVGSSTLYLLKPQTFMNLSGKSVLQLASFYKIKPEQIIVAHDEIDLAPGKVRIKKGGGDGGHNGLKDITKMIGNGYHRLRLGVGRPADARFDTADYVLGKFTDSEKKELDIMSDFFSDRINDLILPDTHTKLLSAYATLRNPPKPKKPVIPPSESV